MMNRKKTSRMLPGRLLKRVVSWEGSGRVVT